MTRINEKLTRENIHLKDKNIQLINEIEMLRN